MSSRSRRALARSRTGERTVITLIGLAALAAGVLGVLVGLGVFGDLRSRRPLLDPIAVDLLRTQALPARLAAIAVGLVLVVLGVWWAVRSLRPEPRPDLYLSPAAGATVRVTASAATDALATDAESVPGVARAKARLVGRESTPALRLTLWLTDGADVRTVWRDVEDRVLARARSSLGVGALPTAIRLELDSSTGRSRVR
ncbi:MAG: alkaline shock response membrane anchor protein AmaP [Pseudonocardia sp.]|jgi:hypothetical protein